MSKPERVDSAHLAGADVVVLDLAELVAERDKPAARDNVQQALGRVRAGGSEAFVQVDPGVALRRPESVRLAGVDRGGGQPTGVSRPNSRDFGVAR